MKNKEGGFKRRLKALYYLAVRGSGTPEYIARGWAIGMFCGCFIPFGVQLIISIPAAIILKGSKIGASVGTLITNPVTIFFIYPMQCYVGNRIVGGSLSWSKIESALTNLTGKDLSFVDAVNEFISLGWELMIAFFVGGALLTAIMTPLTYFAVKKMVIRYREFRARRIAAKSGLAK